MSPRLTALLYLASVIDLKSEKLEQAFTVERKEQLNSQLSILRARFQREFAALREEEGAGVGEDCEAA